MKLLAALLLVTLSACAATPPTRYPISGHPCAPDDPVHDLRAWILPPL